MSERGARQREARRAESERNDRALLQAAREVVAEEGARASAAAIADRAGVGVGTLYRRYRTKEELFQRLSVLALSDYATAAEKALAMEDPWAGLTYHVRCAVAAGTRSLGPLAGTFEVTAEMAALSRRGDEAFHALVTRAHDAGVLRGDVTDVDVILLIEQLGRAPVVEQLTRQGQVALVDRARAAHDRLIAIALDGLRAGRAGTLPGVPPTMELFSARWVPR